MTGHTTRRSRILWTAVCLLLAVWWIDGWLLEAAGQVDDGKQPVAGTQQSKGAGGANPAAQDADGLGGLLQGLDLDESVEEAPRESVVRDPDEADATTGPNELPPFLAAYRAMVEAKYLLAEGKVDEPTLAAQQRAIDKLDEMIEAATADQESGASQSSQSSSEGAGQDQQEESAEAGDQAANEPGEQQATEREESSEGDPATPGPEGEQATGEQQAGRDSGNVDQDGQPQQELAPAMVPSPLDANGEAIWGHLPARTRGLLRAEMPTEFLPQYADDISAYFRALAEMPIDE